jgi:hypothetical protein
MWARKSKEVNRLKINLFGIKYYRIIIIIGLNKLNIIFGTIFAITSFLIIKCWYNSNKIAKF